MTATENESWNPIPTARIAAEPAASLPSISLLGLRTLHAERMRDLASILVIVAVGLIVGIVAAQRGVVDPYLDFRLARIEAWAHLGAFIPYNLSVGYFDQLRPGYELWLASLRMVTGLDPSAIAVFPLGAVALPLAIFALGRTFGLDRATAVLAGVALLLTHAVATVQLGTFIYVVTYVLWISYLTVLASIFLRGRAPSKVFLLVAIFFATQFTYPTTATWMLFVTGAAAVALFLRRWRGGIRNRESAGLFALSLALVGYLAYFDRTLETALRSSAEGGGIADKAVRAIDQLISLIPIGNDGAQPAVFGPFEVAAPATGDLGKYAVIGQYALLGIGLTFGIVLALRFIRARRPGHNVKARIVFVSVLGVATIGHTLAYAAYGHFTTRLLILVGPLAAALLLSTWRAWKPWVSRAWIGAYVAVSLVGMFGLIQSTRPALPDSQVHATADWLALQPTTPVVAADLGLFGKLIVAGAAEGATFDHLDMDSEVFDCLVTSKTACSIPAGTIAVFDRTRLDVPVGTTGWRYFGPPADYWSKISTNDSWTVVFQTEDIVALQYQRPTFSARIPGAIR